MMFHGLKVDAHGRSSSGVPFASRPPSCVTSPRGSSVHRVGEERAARDERPTVETQPDHNLEANVCINIPNGPRST